MTNGIDDPPPTYIHKQKGKEGGYTFCHGLAKHWPQCLDSKETGWQQNVFFLIHSVNIKDSKYMHIG